MRDGWRRFRTMPDRERARLLSLVLGAIIVGVLYALGGISLYLRASFLAPTATTAAGAGISPALTPLAPIIIVTPTRRVSPTLYPTITPTLENGQIAASPAETELPTETPFPSPTAQPTNTPAPEPDQPVVHEQPQATPVAPARPGR